ncbi:tetratricopeptide repeat protein [Geminocystis sp. NIES-3708]|uniref:tetratricopeptide repeat protein n=1 Tax=Geminocystis sp. NIES-3708 TaxID=1615909 RepID=UPI00156BCC0E|nr:tetratricopeptide repeat protein [Geminocystis sp. NIES-3708]
MTIHSNITLSMIVKNEAHNLVDCLNSVKNLVDEIVIVDTGSTDNTKEIANNSGAKVYDYSWQDNFAQARNQTLEYVNTEWVLVLDADEILNPPIIPYIQQVIKEKDNLVVNLIRHEIGALSSPYSQLSRLFRKHPDIKFSRPYHALIDDAVLSLQEKETHWRIVDLPEIAIKHYGYQPEIIASQDKTQRAKKAMESYLKGNPNDAYVCSKLGALYLDLGDTKKGLKLLKTGLKLNLATTATLFELHYHLANALVKEKQWDTAVKHYQKAITQPILAKLKLGAYHNLGSLCYQGQDFNNAIKLYEECLKIEPNFALAYYNLGLTYRAMGRNFKAIDAYQNAIKLNPSYPWAYQNLGVLLYKQGEIEDSIRAFQKAYDLNKQQNPKVAQELKQELLNMAIELTEN